MAAIRSVIDIDVNDDRFKRFVSSFKDYEAGLKKAAPHWKAAERSAEASRQATAHITEQTQKRAAIQKQMDREREKAEAAAAKAERKRLDDAKRRMDGIRSTTASIASNLMKGAGAVTKILGVGGLLGGLLGAGGLFGLTSLASSVSDARRSAMGLGITSGQQKAFGVNFGRYVDANENLQAIADARTDQSRRWAFAAMGINPNGKNTADLAAEMALKAKALWNGGDKSQQFAQSRGLDQFYSLDELRRLGETPDSELRRAKSGYGRDAKAMALSDATQRRWGDFSAQMTRAGERIKAVFVDALTPLAPALEKLSAKVGETIEAFLKSPKLREWIENFGDGIKRFGDYLGSEKFQSDLKTFATNIALIAQKIVDGLRWLKIIPEAGFAADGTPTTAAAIISADRRLRGNVNDKDKSYPRGVINYGDGANYGSKPVSLTDLTIAEWFTKKGLDKGVAAGITASLMKETVGYDPFAKGDYRDGTPTAYGIAQWRGSRQDDYAKYFGHTMQSVTDRKQALEEQMQFILYELTKGKYKAVLEAAQKAATAGDKGAIISERYESPKDKRGEAIRRGAQAEVVLKVYNQTGGNANVQASQAAAK